MWYGNTPLKTMVSLYVTYEYNDGLKEMFYPYKRVMSG